MNIQRKPEWLKKKIDFNANCATSALLKSLDLNTVCHEAKCPNISECFKNRHATFLILGKTCTRHCAFCHVDKNKPAPVDENEPSRVAEAVKQMALHHAVITSVTRDDLRDGGAALFAEVVRAIKKIALKATIELLIPDFQGDKNALKTVTDSKPDIIGHNMETIPRLYFLRPQADYQRSLDVLKNIKKSDKTIYTKSSLLLGLGEKENEVIETMEDLRTAGCDFLALGQYLRPSLKNTPVVEYVSPEKFEAYKRQAFSLGFCHVESAPYVRSSYRAASYLQRPSF